MKSLFTPSLSDLSLSYLSIFNPSLFNPFVLIVSLVSLVTKTKRIGERSAIVTHTHTLSHTDRQSTLAKYMIDSGRGEGEGGTGRIHPFLRSYKRLSAKFIKYFFFRSAI
jgi:hypothetical protein